MKTYELVIVLEGKATPAKKKAEIANIEKLVKVFEGKVVKTEDWGIKELAYPIKKFTTGQFLIFSLELPLGAAKGLGNKLRLEEQIIRYLLIVKKLQANKLKNVKKSK